MGMPAPSPCFRLLIQDLHLFNRRDNDIATMICLKSPYFIELPIEVLTDAMMGFALRRKQGGWAWVEG